MEKNKDIRETAGGVILIPRTKEVIVVETLEPDGKTITVSWPKGGVKQEKKNETHLEATYREIEEETRIKKNHMKLILNTPFPPYLRPSVKENQEATQKRITLYLLRLKEGFLKRLTFPFVSPLPKKHPRVLAVPYLNAGDILKHSADREQYVGHILPAIEGILSTFNYDIHDESHADDDDGSGIMRTEESTGPHCP